MLVTGGVRPCGFCTMSQLWGWSEKLEEIRTVPDPFHEFFETEQLLARKRREPAGLEDGGGRVLEARFDVRGLEIANSVLRACVTIRIREIQ